MNIRIDEYQVGRISCLCLPYRKKIRQEDQVKLRNRYEDDLVCEDKQGSSVSWNIRKDKDNERIKWRPF